MNWQPIETAPRDGTGILAYWKSAAFTPLSYCVTRYCNELESWVDVTSDEDFIEPDYWMPLPPAPTITE